MAEINPDRLESWKEIAAFVGRTERTAMRWANEGMPVQKRRGRVHASREAINQWLRSHPEEESESEIASPPTSKGQVRNKWVLIGTATSFTALVVGIVLMSYSRTIAQPALPSRVAFAEDGFAVFDGAEHKLWAYNFSKHLDKSVFARGESLENLVRVEDFRGDGDREVLVVAPLRAGPNPDDMFQVEVDFFSSRGRLLWSYIPQGSFQFGEHKLEGPWNVFDLYVSDENSKKTIWLSAVHYIWGNSFIAQLDPATGKADIRFVNTGIVYNLNELKTPSGTFLLAAGFNNEYDSGSLAIINERQPFAASPQTSGTRHKCVSCADGAPDYYFVFPRSEINQVEKVHEDPVRRTKVTGQGIEVFKYELRDVEGVETFYSLRTEPTIEPVSLRYGSDYDMLHRQLSAQKKLDHSLDACPERLHPKPIRMWTPTSGWTDVRLKPSRSSD